MAVELTDPLIFRQGEKISWSVVIKSGGAALNLTGWTFTSVLAKCPGGATLATWTPSVPVPANGTVIFTLQRSVTQTVPPSDSICPWVTDGWAFESDGTPHPLPKRPVIVQAAVTP